MKTTNPAATSGTVAWRVALCASAVLGMMALCSCNRETPTATKAATVVPVTLGVGMVPMVSLAIIADAEKLFARERVMVTTRPYASGKMALDDLLAGKLQVVTAAVTPVVFGSFKRRDFSVVASIGSSNNDTVIVARRDRGINQPADLKGRRIATQQASAVHFFLHMFLLKHGLSEKDVTICDLNPADFPKALARGEVDACSLREPLISQALALLGNQAVSFEEPELHVEYYNLLANNRFLDEHPETVHRLLRALVAAETLAKRHPQRAIATVARAFGVDEPTLKRLSPWLDLRVRLSQSLLVAMEDQARWAVENRLAENARMPNYLQFLRLDAMLSVKPSAVSVIR